MSCPPSSDLDRYCREVARRAKRAAGRVVRVTVAKKNGWLRQSAKLLGVRAALQAEANRLDLDAAPASA